MRSIGEIGITAAASKFLTDVGVSGVAAEGTVVAAEGGLRQRGV